MQNLPRKESEKVFENTEAGGLEWILTDNMYEMDQKAVEVLEAMLVPRQRLSAIDYYLFHFIGGPFNATQEYISSTDMGFPHIRNQAFWSKTAPLAQGSTKGTCQLFTYLLTFIPMEQTPFAERTQIVIAVYQE